MVSRNTAKCTSHMKMLTHMHNGQESNSRVKRSGSLPLAEAFTKKSLPGAMSLLLRARKWLIVGKASFPGKTFCLTDMRERPPSGVSLPRSEEHTSELQSQSN